jgi:membrane protein DedA with SNARE-associated domain
MPPKLASYIIQYGYLAIFSLIFAQEMGVPNPVPNELILLFGGYLTSIKTLSLTLTFVVAVLADFIGTTMLYVIFYHFGELVFAHKPRWLPISRAKVDTLAEKVSKGGWWGIFGGRLIPYLRGYTSVAAGVLRVRPSVYLSAVAASAVLWSGGYVIVGRILGSYWEDAAKSMGGIQVVLLGIALLVVGFFTGRHIVRRRAARRNASG